MLDFCISLTTKTTRQMLSPKSDEPIKAVVLYLLCFSIMTLMMTAIMPIERPDMSYKLYIRNLKDLFRVSKVKMDTIIIIIYANKADTKGDIIHDARMINIFNQFNSLNPIATIPAPSSEPMTVCVPEIGMDDIDDVMINKNEAKHTPNIILCYSQYCKSKSFGITSCDNVRVTSFERKYAPTNSKMDPNIIRYFRLKAFDP